VSRTPLREALNRLAADGALSSTPNFGFTVKPLTLEEFYHFMRCARSSTRRR